MTSFIDDRDNKTKNLKEDLETVKAFLENKDRRKEALDLAHQISKEVGNDWFQPKKLLKKFKVDVKEIQNKLIILSAFKLVAYKEERGLQWYKIDINQKDQRLLLQQEIEFHQAQLQILKEKLSSLD